MINHHAYPVCHSPRRALCALAALLLLVVSAWFPASASAAPAPNNGPTAGGTKVSDSVADITFTQVTVAGMATLAIGSDGNTYAWGDNSEGQLGDDHAEESSVTPVRVHTPEGVRFVQIAGGPQHVLAIGADGHVYSWGYNGYGALGHGDTFYQSFVPVKVNLPDEARFTQVSASYSQSLALDSNGNAYGWGLKDQGQLGIGDDLGPGFGTATPLRVKAPDGVRFNQISAGFMHSAALDTDGNAYGWGANDSGQLGIGTNDEPAYIPVKVLLPEGLRFTQISAGFNSSSAVGSDGNCYVWGSNRSGELGNGTTSGIGAFTPQEVRIPQNVHIIRVLASGAVVFALDEQGNIYGWGTNDYGVLGQGATPRQVLVPERVHTPDGMQVSQLSSSGGTAAAISSDGALYQWGRNLYGQLGDGATEDRYVPTPVVIPLTVDDVLFGDVPGTELSQKGNTWTVTSPAGCGVKDVTVNYTQMGVPRTAVTKSGFSQGTAPVITAQPKESSVTKGDLVTLGAAATGDNAPTVQWQQAASADGAWADIQGATTNETRISPTGDTFVRAVFSNCVGTATSDAARIAVTAPAPSPTPTATPTPSTSVPDVTPSAGESSAPAGSQVSTSGTAGGPGMGVAAVLLIAAGAAVIAGYGVKRHNRN